VIGWGTGRWAAFARSFTIQGSFNYRTLIGSGFAFVLLPFLRATYGKRSGALEEALARHAELFNSHPYFAGLAAGAVARLEQSATPPEEISRFKTAVRGPLGAIGDRLVWGRFLPATVLFGVVLVLAGFPWWLAVVAFLVIYNTGHIGLRAWAFRSGLREGKTVGPTLRTARLGDLGELLGRVGSLLVGVTLGLLLARGFEDRMAGGIWAAGLVASFILGRVRGERVSWPATVALGIAVALVLALGGLR
jgi:PTS system mannose-specific IID component